jgi:hypothetical protein
MTDLTGSTRHGSSAYRGPTASPPADPPGPRQEGDGGPEPVGLVEILAVDEPVAADVRPGRAPVVGAVAAAARRPDLLAGPLLLLAGLAAGASLLVVWVHGGVPGLDLVGAGLRDARSGVLTPFGTGSWQPLTVVGSGTVLFVVGVCMYVPTRSHRFLGALALVASLLAAAAVLVPLALADWDVSPWAVGAWCAAAVGGLGLLGALAALHRR